MLFPPSKSPLTALIREQIILQSYKTDPKWMVGSLFGFWGTYLYIFVTSLVLKGERKDIILRLILPIVWDRECRDDNSPL